MNITKDNTETFLELNVLNKEVEQETQDRNNEITEEEMSRNETIIELGCDECAICLDEINYNFKQNIYMLPCLHVYHESCIYEWFEKKREYMCPVCRKIFGDYPVEPYIEEAENTEHAEQVKICFGYIKVETIFIFVYLLLFWSALFFAIIYSR